MEKKTRDYSRFGENFFIIISDDLEFLPIWANRFVMSEDGRLLVLGKTNDVLMAFAPGSWNVCYQAEPSDNMPIVMYRENDEDDDEDSDIGKLPPK